MPTEKLDVARMHETRGISVEKPPSQKYPISSISAVPTKITKSMNNGLAKTNRLQSPVVSHIDVVPVISDISPVDGVNSHGTRNDHHDHHDHHHVQMVLNVHIPHSHMANTRPSANHINIPVNIIIPEVAGGHFHPNDHHTETLGHHETHMLATGHLEGNPNTVLDKGMSENINRNSNQPMALSKKHPDFGIPVENPKPIFLDPPTTDAFNSKNAEGNLASFSKKGNVDVTNLKSISLDTPGNDLFEKSKPVIRIGSRRTGSHTTNGHTNNDRSMNHITPQIPSENNSVGNKNHLSEHESPNHQRKRQRLTAAERMAKIKRWFSKNNKDLEKVTKASNEKDVDTASNSNPKPTRKNSTDLNTLYSMKNMKQSSELGKEKSGSKPIEQSKTTPVPKTIPSTRERKLTPEDIHSTDEKTQINDNTPTQTNKPSEKKTTQKVTGDTNKQKHDITNKESTSNKKNSNPNLKLDQSQDKKQKKSLNEMKPRRRKGFLDLLFISSLAG